ncbi:N-acetylmuramoyl-L-alanine amidase [Citreicella sp. C3M06]|uniref:N-acetylmuramoyl-L-alanine amidase n=1 Tax=Citreicella sp. C3M06 TaxID=2841564 RepID=UPI001C094040|nr:N-acetylmuramoyl-L-alanine amidase [Citreicella sp. C3M06]
MGSRAVPRGARRLTPVWHPSDNFGQRRLGARPDIVVIHYTAMASATAARDWLCNPASEVSAHYVIARTGQCWQLVHEDMRAWHAGRGAWGGISDVNSHSIGIELANTGAEPFAEAQMRSLETLLPGILARWDIPAHRVIGHSDMAPGRKIDPGPMFDWSRLADKALAVCPEPGHAPGDFHADLRRFGYVFTEAQHAPLLAAFRARFRPGVQGPIDDTDARLARALAERWPAL